VGNQTVLESESVMAEVHTSMQRPAVTKELVDEITRKIVDGFHPEKIILFGSHVWGSPQADSDVDLFVVMESDRRPAQRSSQISIQCRPRFLPVDIIVRTPAELEHRLDIHDPFLRRIVDDGIVLYER